MEVLSLPAEGAGDEKERDLLRKELDEARRQGEAYARELAQVFVPGDEPSSPSVFPPLISSASTVERVSTLTRFAGGVAAELRGLIAQIGRDLQLLRGQSAIGGGRSLADEVEDPLEVIKRRLRQVHEFVSELARVGEVDPNEPLAELDLLELVRSAARSVGPQVEQRGIDLKIVTVPEAPEAHIRIRMSPRAAARIVHALLDQAVAATPRGRAVSVTIAAATTEVGPRLTIDDAGASLPASARRGYVSLEFEPSTFGRPSSTPLFVCSELVAWQGAVLELGDAPEGGLRVGLRFAR
jgi:signal transduction histidine kinase